LAVGWLVGRVWRGPTALPAGLWALGGAAVLGLALRGLLTGRLPMAFVLVTALSLALLVLGWRLIAAAVLRTRTVSI
jgi:membrane protein implicated in regulation of membrane protease activity